MARSPQRFDDSLSVLGEGTESKKGRDAPGLLKRGRQKRGWVAWVLLVWGGTVHAEKAAPLSALAKLPVREVTVFKDGHAFVLHAGKMPTDAAGNVSMDHLPTPVLGTFWPYSAEKHATLTAVTASPRKVRVERTALTVRELLEANVGAEVWVTEASLVDGNGRSAPLRYKATLVEVPVQSGEEQELNSPPHSGQKLPLAGSVALLKLPEGVKVVPLDRILDVTFVGEHKQKVSQEEFRNLLTLKLEWDGRPQKEADVGLLYLQRGIRWIPHYSVTVDGKGTAAVKLQATLINELADLEDVTAQLVIGVPMFAFKETVDPISLQQTMAALSPYFQPPNEQNGYGLSNAIMSQQVMPAGRRSGRAAEAAEAAGPDLGPEISTGGKTEDLFVFTVKHVSLKKGQRMVVPVTEVTLKYKDVYALELPPTPPPEVWRSASNPSPQTELAPLFNTPKVMHRIRLFNSGGAPLTTAPALILREGKVLAQGLMTYASPGAEAELEVATAVDVRVKKSENELKRTPNAVSWQGEAYGRVDLAGKLSLTSFGKQAVEVEVTRTVLGNVGDTDNAGKVERLNVLEEPTSVNGSSSYPSWWGGFNWPWWWQHFNGVARVRWTVKLEPGKSVELGYTWNYYWR